MNELNPFKLAKMLEELENTVELHSISVRYKGEKVVEGAWAPFSMEEPQMMHSLSKIEQVSVLDLRWMRENFIWRINFWIM